jgi:hypothetical protein
MKTINKHIDIFLSLENAEKAFNKCESADLLYSKSYSSYYVDKSKTALKDWPKLYELLKTK